MSLRKYDNPDYRSIRQEKALFEFVSECGLEHNSVYQMGAELVWLAFGKTGLLPNNITEKYTQLFDSNKSPIFSPENIQKVVAHIVDQVKTIQTKLPFEQSINDFFNDNIRKALSPEPFHTYLIKILDSGNSTEQKYLIQALLEESGKVNGGKTDCGSHNTNDVYNWLVEVRRGAV